MKISNPAEQMIIIDQIEVLQAIIGIQEVRPEATEAVIWVRPGHLQGEVQAVLPDPVEVAVHEGVVDKQ